MGFDDSRLLSYLDVAANPIMKMRSSTGRKRYKMNFQQQQQQQKQGNSARKKENQVEEI